MKFKRVVVTGLGTINPIGNNIKEYWSNLEQGVSGSELITSFDTTKFKTKFACQVKNFDPLQHFDRKELRKFDPYCQYAMVSAHQAVLDSGLDLEKIDHDAAGVIWASGIGGIQTFVEEMRGYFAGDGTPRFSPFFIPRMIADIAAGHISMRYSFRGPNYATVSACASSNHALIDAMNLIRLGKANIFITGGSDAAINEAGMGGFNSMQAISTNNAEYKTASRPFDGTRDGFVMGEGAGALILEEYEHAKARGAKIYAEIVGGGMTADAYHFTAPHPEGLGAKNVMINALKDANLKPEDVDYINVHGTATPIGDGAELKAVTAVFGEHAYKMNISSTKSMAGHLLGATAAIEAIACIFAINTGIIPPTINHTTPDPEIDSKLNLTLNKAQKREVNVALSNTFGFGGHNSSVIFKKFTE
ncbi:MAG: beta-ketoacyl-ACP synthase II [Bacteroidales bacterium]|nr:beta-ketoacyl-ACP synthase II [Bacteroidales bacterium]MDD3891450.1 beta-ketoacyl-ACP synthase II [Bacteroidales bacterium]